MIQMPHHDTNELANYWVTLVPGSLYMAPTAAKALQPPLLRIVGL